MRSGSLRLSHDAWYLKVYLGKKQRAFRLGHKRDFMNKREVRAAADRKLTELRLVSSGNMARITLDDFLRDWYLRMGDTRLRPSTAKGYRGLWERYIKGRKEAKRPLWEYKTVHVQHLLGGIAMDHKLSTTTHQHIKAFLSGAFRHAVVAGFRESNPVRDTLVPKSSKPSKEPGAYTLDEITRLLSVLSGPAKCAVGIASFAGLRLAEIQGLRAEDCDITTLSVKQTQWRGHTNDPKSVASKNWVPVIPALGAILAEYNATWKPSKKFVEGEDGDGIEVLDTSLFPISKRGGRDGRNAHDLDHVGRREVAQACKKVGLKWKGWHAFRRGLASNLFELGCDDVVVQRILRHARVTVTRDHYIKVRDPRVEDAMSRLSSAVTKSKEQGASKERSESKPTVSY
jgi:integrase